MSGPTTGASEQPWSRWEARPGAARVVRILVVLIPLVASFLAAWTVRLALPQPDDPTDTVLFILAIALVAFATATAVERLSRRLLPLASLLELTLVFPDQAPSRYSTALRTGTTRQLIRQVDEVKANQFSPDPSTGPEQILAMVEALRRHEPLTRGHSERVRAYSALIAEEMGLSENERWRLQWAVLLHDIGKLTVPAALLNKAGAPTDDEWRMIERHPAAGAQMAAPLAGWLGEFVHAVGQHHEKWDGSGYPNGLAGEEISLAGRIVAVADAFDVITAARSYKTPMSAEAARRELVDCAGTHFDPNVVKAMLQASVGRISTRSGRFGWLGHLDALIQPGAVASGLGAAATSAVVATVGLVPSGAVEAETAVPDAANPDAAAYVEEAEQQADGYVTPDTLRSQPMVADPEVRATPPGSETGSAGIAETVSEETTTTVDSSDLSSTVAAVGTSQRRTSSSTTTTRFTTSTASPATVSPTTAPTTVITTANTATTTSSTASAAETTTSQPPTVCQQLRTGAVDDIPGANLEGCDLTGINLLNVNLAGVNLSNADLTGASIQHFNLSGANLTGATLTGASLTDGSASGADLSGADAGGVSITRVDMAYTDLTGTDLSSSTLVDSSFGFATLISTDLSSAVFNGANFNDADATGATFAGASAVGTEFFRTVLASANLAGTNLGSAVLTDATGTPLNTGSAIYDDTTCPDGTFSSSPCW